MNNDIPSISPSFNENSEEMASKKRISEEHQIPLPPAAAPSHTKIKEAHLMEDQKLTFVDEKLQPQPTDDERFISQVWNDGKGHAAKEVVERLNTVEELNKSTRAELKYLKENNPKSPRIKELENTLKKQESAASSTWVSSESFRTILRENKVEKAPVSEALLSFEKAINDHYAPLAAPVNMRYHTCEATVGTSGHKEQMGWLRVGVISDMSNGYVNLEQLKKLNEMVESGNPARANFMRGEMARGIIKEWKKHADNPQVVASAGYALKQIGYSVAQIQQIEDNLKTRPTLYANFEIGEKGAEAIKETVRKRENLLAQQFLQMVVENVKHASKEQLKTGTLKMMHVCLLNEKSRSIDKTGWNHDEKNEMYDMNAIFEQFDGKKLIADGKGPFIDESGNIHLPAGIPHVEYGEGKELNLRSLFVNQCVQGSFTLLPVRNSPTDNKGDQKIINERTRKKLKEMGIQNETLESAFKAKKTGFGNAANIIKAANEEGFLINTGCMSAKDRTGFLSALISDDVMREFPKASRTKFMRGQIKKTATAGRIIRENTGQAYMKLTNFRIDKVTKGEFNIKSFAVRTNVYVHQLAAIIKSYKT